MSAYGIYKAVMAFFFGFAVCGWLHSFPRINAFLQWDGRAAPGAPEDTP